MYLIKNFMFKDLKNRYAGSMMGFVWSIIHPLTTLAVYSVVFSWMLKMRVGLELGTDNFTIWMFAGLLPWIFFSETLSRSTSVVLDNSNLIKKTVFPSEILPISLLLSNAVNFIIGLIILLGGMYLTGQSFSIVSLLYVIVYIIPLSMFTLGLSWLCSSLNIFFRDLGQLVTVILNIVFYASSIIYPITVVPNNVRDWFFINPMIHVVEGIRRGLFKSEFISIEGLMYLYLFSIFMFVFGQYIFQKTKKGFVDVL
ncbi:Teichoic acid translocation permease protein TagG [compost metagenome]